MYQVGSFPSWNRWAEWNGKYRDDLRRFLKGDDRLAQAAVQRICGSPDLYPPEQRQNASVNFLTCHDGFTLYDLYAYNEKHNQMNGWDNTDGADDNNSWNCGAEGETDDPEINALRSRLRKNAFAVLLCSRGAAMFPAGDEFGNTQFGNNNPYCQDNEISWLDWNRLDTHRDLFEFVQGMIALRRAHPILRGATGPAACGWPDVSLHNGGAWNGWMDGETRQIGVLFAGKHPEGEGDDIVLLAINAHWERHDQHVPAAPEGMRWRLAVHTSCAQPLCPDTPFDGAVFTMGPRSVAVVIAEPIPENE